jgi:hypothetical protein
MLNTTQSVLHRFLVMHPDVKVWLRGIIKSRRREEV